MNIFILPDGSCTSMGGKVMVNRHSSDHLYPAGILFEVKAVAITNGEASRYTLASQGGVRMQFKPHQLFGGQLSLRY